MISVGNPQSPNYDIDIPGIDDIVAKSNPADVAAQWDAVKADGIITVEELRQYPELTHHIEVTLGYGSTQAFLGSHELVQPGSGNGNGTYLEPSEQSLEVIDASISGSLDGGVQYTEGSSNLLPTNIDPESTFVVFTLRSGEKITFDGPRAGNAANEFSKIYNNSPTFRYTIITLAGRQGGQYSFHSLPMEGKLGINYEGTSDKSRRSGVFLQSDPSQNAGLTYAIIHEVAHDLHVAEGHDHDHEGVLDAGTPHSREQSIYHSTIVNELKENGVDLGFDVDGEDYSNDTLVFDGDYDSSWDWSTDEATTEDVVIDENGTEVNALDYYTGKYGKAKDLIAQGRYEEAKAILNQIPPDAQITINFINPNTGIPKPVTYNVRELILQDLMFASDSGDRFNTGKQDLKFKTSLGEFLSDLSRDGTWSATVKSAAADINFNLSRELISYKPPQTEAERIQTRQEFHRAWSV